MAIFVACLYDGFCGKRLNFQKKYAILIAKLFTFCIDKNDVCPKEGEKFMQIVLPRYDWLVAKQEGKTVTNVFSDSRGTVSGRGCVGVTTFNYKVTPDLSEGEENAKLIVECYVQSPWKPGGATTATEPVQAVFEGSEQGLRDAEAWLTEQLSTCPLEG